MSRCSVCRKLTSLCLGHVNGADFEDVSEDDLLKYVMDLSVKEDPSSSPSPVSHPKPLPVPPGPGAGLWRPSVPAPLVDEKRKRKEEKAKKKESRKLRELERLSAKMDERLKDLSERKEKTPKKAINSLFSCCDDSSLARELECSICLEPFDDPVFHNNSGCLCTFCRSCIGSAKVCFNCQQPILRGDIVSAPRVLLNLIGTINVKCRTCNVELKRERAESHECGASSSAIPNPDPSKEEKAIGAIVNEVVDPEGKKKKKKEEPLTTIARVDVPSPSPLPSLPASPSLLEVPASSPKLVLKALPKPPLARDPEYKFDPFVPIRKDSGMNKISAVPPPAKSSKGPISWSCSMCTFLNPKALTKCEMCTTPRMWSCPKGCGDFPYMDGICNICFEVHSPDFS